MEDFNQIIIIKRLNIPICAILLAKPSMQVLYERVLRRPYPRSQRHVYIGMSCPLQYLKHTCLSLPSSLHSSFILLETPCSFCLSHFSETGLSFSLFHPDCLCTVWLIFKTRSQSKTTAVFGLIEKVFSNTSVALAPHLYSAFITGSSKTSCLLDSP